jgi:hypothetical protein
MQPKSGSDAGSEHSLSLKTLRLLHRYLGDFVQVKKARSGLMSASELERLLRSGGADPDETRYVIAEYHAFTGR